MHLSTTVLSLVLVLGSGALVIGAWRRLDRGDPAVLLGRARPVLERGFRVDDLIAAYVVRPVWGLARAVVAGDRDVVDFYVQGSGRATRLLGGALRLLQNGNVSVYLSLLLAGVVVLAVAALGVRA